MRNGERWRFYNGSTEEERFYTIEHIGEKDEHVTLRREDTGETAAVSSKWMNGGPGPTGSYWEKAA